MNRSLVPARQLLVLVGLGLLLSGPSAVAATLSGRVPLPAPSGPPVVTQRYEIIIEADRVRTDPPRAVVYLQGSFAAPDTPPVARMDQRDLGFLPQLLPVRVGTRVEFPNFDPVFHNVFSFSPAKRFDLGRYRAHDTEVPSVVFDQPGLVTVRCDIHEHMRAAILVLDTPHFVITDAEGRFSLTDLPAGRYVLKAWIDSQTELTQSIELQAGAVVEINFP